MPVLLQERVIQYEFSDLYSRKPLLRPAQPRPRASCAHVSDVLSYLARYTGRLKPGEPLEEDMPDRVAMGIQFEEFWFSLAAAGDTDWQPGEAIAAGIAGNCDGLGTCSYLVGAARYEEPCIDETKCTEKKVRSGEQFLEAAGTDWYWLHQGREYCYLYGPVVEIVHERPLRIVRYTVQFYRGNYRGSGPITKQFLIRFSDQEVESTHAMLLTNRDVAMAEKEAQLVKNKTGVYHFPMIEGPKT